MDAFSTLPIEIVSIILLLVAYPQLVRRICKTWYELLREVPDNDNICDIAVANGELTVLKWARQQNYPWSNNTAAHAAELGRIDILEWLQDNGCPIYNNAHAAACRNGSMELLEWFHNNIPVATSNIRMSIAHVAAKGDLDHVKWLVERGYSPIECIASKAARHGHLHILEWLHSIGKLSEISTNFICRKAARGGYMEVIEWLMQHGQGINSSTIDAAAAGGHINVLEMLVKRGYCITGHAYGAAIRNARTDVFMRLLAYDIPKHESACIRAAARNDLPLLISLYDSGFPLHKDVAKKPLNMEILRCFNGTSLMDMDGQRVNVVVLLLNMARFTC